MAAVVLHVVHRRLIAMEESVPSVIERKLCLMGSSNEVPCVAVLTGLFVMSPGGVVVVGGNVMAGRSIEAYWKAKAGGSPEINSLPYVEPEDRCRAASSI
jgi:hypothetical protein